MIHYVRGCTALLARQLIAFDGEVSSSAADKAIQVRLLDSLDAMRGLLLSIMQASIAGSILWIMSGRRVVVNSST
jgi:sulfate adenylyltransferase subunit 1 (EFTu-like GTPase family)